MIIVACTAMGFEKSRELQRHLKELEELKRIFTLIQSELQYTKAAFAEVFFKISRKTDGKYKKWLRELAGDLEKREKGTFQEVWEYTHI